MLPHELDEVGMTTAELLGNAALGVLALVVIWAALQALGLDIVNMIRDALDQLITLIAGRMRRSERGFTTVQYVVAIGFSLLLFVMIGNLLVDLYARGALRDALDEGVRAGVPVASTAADCETHARDVVTSIAGGASVRVDELHCEIDSDRVVARADVSLRSWLPMIVPDWQLHLAAAAEREE